MASQATAVYVPGGGGGGRVQATAACAWVRAMAVAARRAAPGCACPGRYLAATHQNLAQLTRLACALEGREEA